MRIIVILIALHSFFSPPCFSQIDTSFIYNPSTAYGPLDLRIAKSSNDFYFLQKGITYSFRTIDDKKTNSYLDMTAWDSSPYEQGNMRESVNGIDKFVMNYRLLMPANYAANYRQGYPLVLVLHGLQERGNCAGASCYHSTVAYSPNTNTPPASTASGDPLLNNDYNLVHGGSNYLDAARENGDSSPDDPSLPARAFPGFVLFPQNLNGWDATSVEDAIRIVRLMIKKYNIDENRIYINGVSMGGQGAYEAMKRAPWLFAAGILFSAADDASLTDKKLEVLISGIPLWIFQGEIDKNPSPKKTEQYVKRLRIAGASIRYTLYPHLGHGTWNKAFSEPDFFSWMLRQRKNNIHVFADQPVICKTSGSGALLELPKGHSSYQWELNGKVLAGVNGHQFVTQQPGAYRGRFADDNGGYTDWSDVINVIEKDPQPVPVKQIGTILLKDPNGNNELTLKTEGNYAHYYWLKNGTRIDFPGQEDDTTKVARLKSSYGDGIYTLQVSGYDNCLSPPSHGKHVFFSDRAPVNIDTPESLSLIGGSTAAMSVSWEDVSADEDGFEIWRRRRVEGEQTSAWEMATLTQANATSFSDQGLSPSSTYEYIIRAVSATGRSLYSATKLIETMPDNIPPSQPGELKASIVGVKSIKLTWKTSVDNSSIKEYVIYTAHDTIHTESADTTFIFKDYEINSHYTFYVKAMDTGNNLSGASNPAEIYTRVSGLFYQHSTGVWSSLDEIDWSIAEFQGMVGNFSLSPKTQVDFFNFRFDGYLNIEHDGVYQFRISSNDGSRLSLDDSLLITNDGVHNLTTVAAPIQLLADGPHRVTVDFFDYTLTDSLLVEYKGPDSNNEWKKIPSEKLSSELVTSVEEPEAGDTFDFVIYPNPAKGDQMNIVLSRIPTGPLSVSVLENTGKEMYRAMFPDYHFNDPITLSELKLPVGFYIVVVEQNRLRKAKKLIVRR